MHEGRFQTCLKTAKGTSHHPASAIKNDYWLKQQFQTGNMFDMFVILKLNGSIFREPVRTQGTTKGTNKGEKRLSGHILRLLMFCPSGLLTASSLSPHTYRLVSVNLAPARYWPGGQSDQESPGVVMEEVVVVEGPLTCGLPRQLKAARFC